MSYKCVCYKHKTVPLLAGSKEKEEEEGKELPSLDCFLAKATSEDNASFEQIMELAKDKEKLKHAWMYEAELESAKVCQTSAPLPIRCCAGAFACCTFKAHHLV